MPDLSRLPLPCEKYDLCNNLIISNKYIFSEKDSKMEYKNVSGVINNKYVEFNTSSDFGLSKIKFEFDEEETKIQYGVLENQLQQEKVDDSSPDITPDITKLHNGAFLKTEPTASDTIFKDNVKSEVNDSNKEFSASMDHELSNIKCEFEEEETQIQYGVLENQLEQEKVDDSSPDIIELHNGAFPGSFLKTEPIASDTIFKDNVKSEVKDSNKEFSASMDHELSNIKCEFEEEETKIQYGVLENQLEQEKVDDSSPDIIELHNGAFPGSFLKTEPIASDTVFKDNVKSEVNDSNKEFSASMDHELSNIKCEFEEEETKIQHGVKENQLQQEKVDDSSPDITKLHNGAFLKTDPTGSDTIFKDKVKSEVNDSNKEFSASMDHELSNIKCEFEEEETKIQHGVKENQLQQENVDDSSPDIIELHNGVFPGSFLKTEPTASDTIFKDNVKSEVNDSHKEFSASMDHELSYIKCEFEEEETKIQHGVKENQLQQEKVDDSSPHITKLHNGAFLKTEPRASDTIFKDNVKSEINDSNKEFSASMDHELSNNKCGTFNTTNLTKHMRIHTGEKPYKCDTCGKGFNQRENLITHMKIHPGDNPYKCDTCGKSFSQRGNLITHMKIHTGEKTYKCDTCGKSFNRRRNLITHMKIHTGEKTYKCNTCGKSFSKRRNLITHMKIHTGEKRYKCDTCGKCFIIKAYLNCHMKIHTEEKPYKCDTCGKSFTQRRKLITHMKIHTGEKPYKCDTCGKCFIMKADLNCHMKIHTGKNPYKCDTCEQSFSLRGNLITHMKIHTGEKPYKCDTCGKSFNQRGNLITHMKIHTGEKPYKCDTCGKCFIMKADLNCHMKIHTGKNPYKCDTCEQRFSQRGNLITHMKIHTGEKPYKCDTCGKSFNQRGNLITHMKIHTGEKLYKCDTCGKCFIMKADLNCHMKIHTGKNPYKCDTCEQSFSQWGNLITHMKIHTGEKPYKCDTCGKSFNQRGNLITHMKIHTGEKPYKCDTCRKSFIQRRNLITHMKIHTGEKLYKCDTCGKSFNQRGNLITHMKIHQGENPYKCDTCGKSFSQRRNYITHMKIHTGEKP